MMTRKMRLVAITAATNAIKKEWEDLGYQIELKPTEPFAAEIEIYDGKVYIDTITITLRRKIK